MKTKNKKSTKEVKGHALNSSRNFQQPGKWVLRPVRSVILTCACGYKYINTRKGQTSCIKCSLTVK